MTMGELGAAQLGLATSSNSTDTRLSLAHKRAVFSTVDMAPARGETREWLIVTDNQSLRVCFLVTKNSGNHTTKLVHCHAGKTSN